MSILIITNAAAQQSSIVVQTRKGEDIENFSVEVLPNTYRREANVFKANHKLAIERSKMSGAYNCHGLAFASRRTCIPESSEVKRILRDDDYRPVSFDNVAPGDIVLYSYPDSGEIHHSGIVVGFNKNEQPSVPIIVSKWGFGHEMIHSVYDCPYTKDSAISYYRIVE